MLTLKHSSARRKHTRRLLLFDCRDLLTVLFLLQENLRRYYAHGYQTVVYPDVMVVADEDRCTPNSVLLQILTWHSETTLSGYIKDIVLVKGCTSRLVSDVDASLASRLEMRGLGLLSARQSPSQRHLVLHQRHGGDGM